MNETIIRRAFEEKRQEIRKDVEDIYAEIAETVKSRPVERMTKEITIAEASRLNTYCQGMEQSLRKTVCGKLKEAGAPDNEVNIIWAQAKRKAGTAQIQLCREEKRDVPPQSGRKPDGERKTEKQQGTKGSGPVIFASGVAVEIIGWVFVPGIGKFAAIVKTAAKGAGLVIMAAGAYKTYEESRETPRIHVSGELPQREYDETEQVIDSICENQCRLNTSILLEWMDAVCDAVFEACGGKG